MAETHDPTTLTFTPVQRELPPEGTHWGVVVAYRRHRARPVSTHPEWAPRPAVQLIYQLNVRRTNGRRHLVSRWYSETLHVNAALRRDIEALLRRPLTADETEVFSLERLIERNAMVTIDHRPYERWPGIIGAWVKHVAPWPYHLPRFAAEGVHPAQPAVQWVGGTDGTQGQGDSGLRGGSAVVVDTADDPPGTAGGGEGDRTGERTD